MAGEPVSSSLQSHPETLCLSAVRKSFFYPEPHSCLPRNGESALSDIKLYMGKARTWWTANPGSGPGSADSTCAVYGSSLQLLGYIEHEKLANRKGV